jgi:hypothetical protein
VDVSEQPVETTVANCVTELVNIKGFVNNFPGILILHSNRRSFRRREFLEMILQPFGNRSASAGADDATVDQHDRHKLAQRTARKALFGVKRV